MLPHSKMTPQSKFSGILATGRISNLPTVWCNVLVAFLIVQLGPLFFNDTKAITLDPTLFIVGCISASCLYVGGCFLGDAIDVEFDMAHKPTRPIPMGILDRQSVYTWGNSLITTGITLPAAYLYLSSGKFHLYPFITSLALAGVIVAYSIWHKKSPWFGLPLIGACRFFLVLFGGALAGAAANVCALPLSLCIFAAVVGLYTICFASVARSESSPKPITWRKGLIALMLSLPLLAKPSLGLVELPFINLHKHDTYYVIFNFDYPSIIALGLYLAWMVSAFLKINSNKGQFVSMSLAGFCILDACFASFLGWPWLIVCVILFVFSLILQKWAPAT